MQLDTDTIKLAQEGNFSDFANVIKDELKEILRQNDVVQEYQRGVELCSQYKAAYASITNS